MLEKVLGPTHFLLHMPSQIPPLFPHYFPPAPGTRFFNEDGTRYTSEIPSMALTPITDLNALQQQIQSGAVVLVDFWAQWCGSCKAMMPTLEAQQGHFPDVTMLKCDIEAAPAIAEAFGVTSLPTLVLFKGGKLINKLAGSLNRPQLRDFLDSAF